MTPFLTVRVDEDAVIETVSFSFPPCPRSCSPSLFYGLRALAFSSITPFGAVRVFKNAVIICFRWIFYLKYLIHALILISLAWTIIGLACHILQRVAAAVKLIINIIAVSRPVTGL